MWQTSLERVFQDVKQMDRVQLQLGATRAKIRYQLSVLRHVRYGQYDLSGTVCDVDSKRNVLPEFFCVKPVFSETILVH